MTASRALAWSTLRTVARPAVVTARYWSLVSRSGRGLTVFFWPYPAQDQRAAEVRDDFRRVLWRCGCGPGSRSALRQAGRRTGRSTAAANAVRMVKASSAGTAGGSVAGDAARVVQHAIEAGNQVGGVLVRTVQHQVDQDADRQLVEGVELAEVPGQSGVHAEQVAQLPRGTAGCCVAGPRTVSRFIWNFPGRGWRGSSEPRPARRGGGWDRAAFDAPALAARSEPTVRTRQSLRCSRGGLILRRRLQVRMTASRRIGHWSAAATGGVD